MRSKRLTKGIRDIFRKRNCFSIDPEALGKKIDNAYETLSRIDTIKKQSRDQKELITSLRDQLRTAQNYSVEVGVSLQNASRIVDEVNKVIKLVIQKPINLASCRVVHVRFEIVD